MSRNMPILVMLIISFSLNVRAENELSGVEKSSFRQICTNFLQRIRPTELEGEVRNPDQPIQPDMIAATGLLLARDARLRSSEIQPIIDSIFSKQTNESMALDVESISLTAALSLLMRMHQEVTKNGLAQINLNKEFLQLDPDGTMVSRADFEIQKREYEGLVAELSTMISAAKNPEQTTVSLSDLYRVGFKVSLILTHFYGRTSPALDGRILYRDQKSSTPSRSTAPVETNFSEWKTVKNLSSAVPTFGSFHPETYLYLMAHGVMIWEIGVHPRKVDNSLKELEPFQISIHDGVHLHNTLRSNYNTKVSKTVNFFESLWSDVINKSETLWERELAIHILYYIFVEQAEVNMSVGGLELGLNEYFLGPHTLGNDYSLFLSAGEENGFGSSLLRQKPISIESFLKQANRLRLWLRSQQGQR